MSFYILKNELITIKVESKGAELRSLKDNYSGKEYMWCGDAAFWGRVSPILFPVVGAYKDKECRYMGKTYSLPQHGFARDMEFALKEKTEDTIWFSLKDDETTRENYPFKFVLEIGYKIADREVSVMWRVKNINDGDMYFSIGGHPAFSAPEREKEKTTCYIGLKGLDSVKVRKLDGGLASDEVMNLILEDGLLAVSEELFADDALIIENGQTGEVSLLDEDKNTYLTVSFDAPLFGLWTPPGKNAPFICIEPWYGRCDSVHFTGNLEEREWGNILKAGECFESSYSIRV